jgi:succinyl-diaminopimelate desuccinylase
MYTDLEATLAKLISFPSITSDTMACHAIFTYVHNEVKGHDLHITSEANATHPWLIATTQDTQKPDIVLAAHLDVVPGAPDLFTMRSRNGRLYGRGAYDMKLAAACYLEFIKLHKAELSQLNIGFLFTTDEESGGASVVTILESGWQPRTVFIPDGGDNWQVEERAKGFYGIELTAQGKTAHGSRPWEGKNALHQLLDALTHLRRSFPLNNPADSTLAVNEIHAGTAVNQIADYASAKLDFRSFSKEELALYHTQVNELASRYNLEVHILHEGLPLLLDKKAPAVQHFLKVLQTQTRTEVTYCESYGASDARHFAQYGIPCIVMEPHGGGRHSSEEWLHGESFHRYYDLIEKWLLSEITLEIPSADDGDALFTHKFPAAKQ